LKRVLLPIALGVLGFVLAFGGWHLWLDHKAMHQVFEIVAAAQQRQQAQQPVQAKPAEQK
jgi:hypothetical protein